MSDTALQQSLLPTDIGAPAHTPSNGPRSEVQANTRTEVQALLTLSAPVTAQLASQYAIQVISQSYVGHQGAASLTAAAIGHTVWHGMNVRALICSQLTATSF